MPIIILKTTKAQKEANALKQLSKIFENNFFEKITSFSCKQL